MTFYHHVEEMNAVDYRFHKMFSGRYTDWSGRTEYHTSLDDLNLISETGLQGGFEIMQKILQAIELDFTYQATTLCEPQLGKRGLYPTIGQYRASSPDQEIANMMNFLAYSDGENSLLDIAETIGVTIFDCADIAKKMEENALVRAVQARQAACAGGG